MKVCIVNSRFRQAGHAGVTTPFPPCAIDGGSSTKVSKVWLFLSNIQSYRVGLSVVITFPYSYATTFKAHFYGKVVRIDGFSDGQFGIAVELIVTIVDKQSGG